MAMMVMTTMWMIRKPIMAQLYVAPNGLQVAVLAGTSHTQNDDTYIIIAAQIHTTHNTYPRHPYILCIFERLRCCLSLGLWHTYMFLMFGEVGAKNQSSISQLRFRSLKSSGSRCHLRTAWSSIGTCELGTFVLLYIDCIHTN